MNIRFTSLFVFASLALASTQIQAESLVAGSINAGKEKAASCTACHGTDGNSVNSMWPNLAGQNAPYLLDQLQAYKEGRRKDPIMSTQVLALSDQDMANLAVYLESLPAAAQAVADEGLLDRGESLYRGGNQEKQIAACMACHGPAGRGNPAAKYPALKGQHAAYVAKQLTDYASAVRTTDGKTRMMQDIAARLDKEDIAALSSYVQGLK